MQENLIGLYKMKGVLMNKMNLFVLLVIIVIGFTLNYKLDLCLEKINESYLLKDVVTANLAEF